MAVFSSVLYEYNLFIETIPSIEQDKSIHTMVLEDIDGTFVNSSASKPDCPDTGLAQQKSHEEHQYLDLIRRIISEGEHRPDRYFTHPR